MKSKYLALVLLIIGILIAAYYLAAKSSSQASAPYTFVVNNRSYKITAYESTEQQLEEGLMNATVTNSTFALFNLGKPGIYPFWMKDTYYQLDIIWLYYNTSTGTARVVYIANATPCVDYSKNQTSCIIYTPPAYANYVLEAKQGFADSSGISVGSTIKLLYGN
jgi:uncharacterized membrane protein (UPF0127 family)